jgi:predicted metallopeptidase
MDVELAPDVEDKVRDIVSTLSYGGGEEPSARAHERMEHVNEFRLICMRSRNATASAYARIWNLPDIWQKALEVGTFYIIEVLAQHYDKLSEEEKEKVIIHELLHIPKTFSGALRPHHGTHVKINAKTVNELHKMYKARKKELEGKRKGELGRAEAAF